MPRTPALFNAPIEFTDTTSGKQVSLPLTSVFFDGNAIKAEGALYTANKTAADAWLTYLAKIGALTPDASPPTKAAMVIKAKDPGANGNFIQIKFSNFDKTNPADPKFDAAVTETDTYAGLKPDTVQTVLGSAAGNGSKPGLVFVPGAAPTSLPKAGSYNLTVTNPNPFADVTIPKNTGPGDAFKLQAKANGADGASIKVDIKDVDTNASTFSLIATWTKTAAQITTSQVGTTFAYEVEVQAPSGGSISPPAPGTITLSGGADAANATKASAVVPG